MDGKPTCPMDFLDLRRFLASAAGGEAGGTECEECESGGLWHCGDGRTGFDAEDSPGGLGMGD